MTANLTLDVIGTDTGTFTVYQDSDQYTTPVASGLTAAQLSTPYSLTNLDASTTTLRVVSSGSCNTYKDISVNFGDTTPSITKNSDKSIYGTTITSQKDSISYASDGVSRVMIVFSPTSSTLYMALATSASSWSFTSEPITIPGVTYLSDPSLIYDGSNFYMFIQDQSSNRHSIYRIDGFSGSDSNPSASSLTLTLTSDLGPASGASLFATPYDYRYINNKYYILTEQGVFRSSDNVTFSNVLPLAGAISSKRKSIDNYGNTIFFCVDGIQNGSAGSIYKSTDNGKNWSVIFTGGNNGVSGLLDGIFVEDLDNIILYTTKVSNTISETNYYHSGDGGVTFTEIPLGNYVQSTVDGMIQMLKHNSVYIYLHFTNGTLGKLAYVSGSLPSGLSTKTDIPLSTYEAIYLDHHIFVVRDKLFFIYEAISQTLWVSTFTIANT